MTSAESQPEMWEAPDPERVAEARTAAVEALRDTGDRPVAERLATYYEVEGNYVGATFVELQPIDNFAITPADILAVRLMNAPIGARSTRQLLGSHHADIRSALLELPLGDDLPGAGQALFDAMELFHLAIKAALDDPEVDDPNPWVSTSKLCARKRPGLFPVRDDKVCRHLRLLAPRRRNWYRTDWQVFQELLLDGEIVHLIDEAQDKVRKLGRVTHQVDMHRLRVLDAALWTAA
jgi:hypothetical protein